MLHKKSVRKASLISSVAPCGTVSADIEDIGQPVPLYPQEALYVANAAQKRIREFALGRACARVALGGMGLDAEAIPRGANGGPIWPAGIVGSITHTEGYAAAIAAEQGCFLCVGVDAERVGGLTDDLMPLLFGASETAWLETFDSARRALLATIFFSAKEAYYKAWNPSTGKPLSFLDLHIDLASDGFVAMQPDAPPDWRRPIKGNFAIQGDLVVTSVCIPNRAGATGSQRQLAS